MCSLVSLMSSSSSLHLSLGCWCSRRGSWTVAELLVTDFVIDVAVAAAATASGPIPSMACPPRAQSVGLSTDCSSCLTPLSFAAVATVST